MNPYKAYVRDDQLFLALYGSTIIQTPSFLKNIENFVWFPKQYLLGFFILEKQLPNILEGGLTATIATAKIGPGFESPKPGYNFF